jgi:hypothetical protein
MTRTRSLADVLPVAAIEPDGLLMSTGGRYVRLLECTQPLQPQRGGQEHRDTIRSQLATLAARIPAGQAIQVVVDAEPLDIDRELAPDWAAIDTASDLARRREDAARAEAMRRLGYGLEQTIRRSAAAVEALRPRYTIAASWRPAQHPSIRSRRAVRSLSYRDHERAAADSLRYTDTIAAELTAAGCQLQALDAPRALHAIARGLRPTPDADEPALAAAAQVLETTDPGKALEHRHAVLAALGPAPIDTAHRDWLCHPATGELEAVLHLTTPPSDTTLWWLQYLMQAPPPWRLAVHITAGDRARQRRTHRLRRKRLWADLRRRERDGKLIAEEAYEQEREAAELDAELRLSGTSGIYDVSVYLAIRRPAGSEDELADLLAALARDFESYTDARLYTGRFVAEDSWVSTLTAGVDRLRATRRYAHRNIGDCLPLLSGSASSSAGVPFAYADPGGTLERVDFFDERYRTHVALITGSSGTGKTVATNLLLARNLARGATGYIIDRSSSEDEGGSTRHAGHYEQLAALIPGARIIHFGAGHHEAILCPWDVADPTTVPASKVEFLIALHTMLIGDPHRADAAVLSGLERTLLARGIEAVYHRCAQSGEPPREQLLYQELRRLAREQAADGADGDASVASELRRLAARLHPYIGNGASAWLADRPTSVPTEAPLVLCDLAGVPDTLAGPVTLTLVEHIDRAVARRRSEHIRDPGAQAGPWAGRAFLAIDEAWKALMSPAAGAWLNERARRTRHIACALLIITQHLSDLANPQGHALLRNSVLRLLFRTSHDELAYVQDTLGLHPEDLDLIEQLETRKGEYSSCFIDSEAHGRTRARIYLGDMEYWTCSADPHRDQPIRELALKEAHGDPWEALRRLVDPAWHRDRAAALTAAVQKAVA